MLWKPNRRAKNAIVNWFRTKFNPYVHQPESNQSHNREEEMDELGQTCEEMNRRVENLIDHVRRVTGYFNGLLQQQADE
ncbi:hypothetical protein Ciccas_004183 [Cichlidogyrus casuarinus]|uniref:Uncharacterized protein n=1 Tax=Cichlidogyrus casuarinus TaxID=1844966 RepID=A0ABD2QD52_9PLAT